MPEVVPADISAAIEKVVTSSWNACASVCDLAPTSSCLARVNDLTAALAALDAAILKHLHGYAEMKAALEAQTSGA